MKNTAFATARLRLLVSSFAFFLTTVGESAESAVTAPTRFASVQDGRKIAYRSVGAGPALVLCNRFRGTLDTWDPAFLDGLARHFRVITFDYRGIGRSSGEAPQAMMTMAEDARDLIVALKLGKVALGGWSMGGMAAQTLATVRPELISHLVLIGTTPAGNDVAPMEPLFLETAHKSTYGLTDEYILFFEPASEASRHAAKLSHERIAQRTQDLDVPMPPAVWPGLARATAEFKDDLHGARAMLTRTRIPILILHGDHDIVFPVQSWHALNRAMPTAQLVIFPHAGHGPQHQFVDESVGYIATFVRAAR